MLATDVFKSSPFEMLTLTEGINKVPFLPGSIGRLRVFEEVGIPTLKVMIEEREGVLYLVENQLRGAPAKQNRTAKRKAREFSCTHLVVGDRIVADEVQNVRAFGSNNALEGIQAVVDLRTTTMSRSLDATLEFLRMGAIKGQILDADGQTVIYDLFTEFNVSQHDVVDFDLDNSNPGPGVLRKKCTAVSRLISDELGAAVPSSIHCLCGDAFFDDLTAHPEVRETFLAQSAAAQLREGVAYETFRYGGIVFENYRGKVNNVPFIHTDEAHFFPVGVPGLFTTYFAPGDYQETVNTIGLPKYLKSAPDPSFNKWVDLEAQSNPLPICTRPKVLIKATRT